MTWTLEAMKAAIGRTVRFTLQEHRTCGECGANRDEMIDVEEDGYITGWRLDGPHGNKGLFAVVDGFGDFDWALVKADDLIFIDGGEE